MAMESEPEDKLWQEWWQTAQKINDIYRETKLYERDSSPVRERLLELQDKLDALSKAYREAVEVIEELAK